MTSSRREAESAEEEHRLFLRPTPYTELQDEALAEIKHLAWKVERLTLRAEGAEQQASRAIARLANVVETVRVEANNFRKAGNPSVCGVLLELAAKLQKMELP